MLFKHRFSERLKLYGTIALCIQICVISIVIMIIINFIRSSTVSEKADRTDLCEIAVVSMLNWPTSDVEILNFDILGVGSLKA